MNELDKKFREYRLEIGENFPVVETMGMKSEDLIKLIDKCIEEDVEASEYLNLNYDNVFY